MKNENLCNKINPEEHLKLVHACCQRFRSRGADYDDVFQSGCIGLVKAAKNFDSSRGVQFSTYAVPVILGEIKTFFQNNTSVKINRSTREIAFKINREREKYINLHNEEPSINYIAEVLNLPVETVVESLDVYTAPISLDSAFENGKKPVFEPAIDFDSENLCNRLSVIEVINKFDEKDRRLIYLRFFKGETQCKIAQILSMTQVQVSRREKFLLKNLREMLA